MHKYKNMKYCSFFFFFFFFFKLGYVDVMRLFEYTCAEPQSIDQLYIDTSTWD